MLIMFAINHGVVNYSTKLQVKTFMKLHIKMYYNMDSIVNTQHTLLCTTSATNSQEVLTTQGLNNTAALALDISKTLHRVNIHKHHHYHKIQSKLYIHSSLGFLAFNINTSTMVKKFVHTINLTLLPSFRNWKDLKGSLSQDMITLSAYLQT